MRKDASRNNGVDPSRSTPEPSAVPAPSPATTGEGLDTDEPVVNAVEFLRNAGMVDGASDLAEYHASLLARVAQAEQDAVTEFAMYLTQFSWMPKDQRRTLVADYLAARATPTTETDR